MFAYVLAYYCVTVSVKNQCLTVNETVVPSALCNRKISGKFCDLEDTGKIVSTKALLTN